MAKRSQLNEVRQLQQKRSNQGSKPDVIITSSQGEWTLERLERLVDTAISQGSNDVWLAIPKVELDRLTQQIPPGYRFKLPVHMTHTDDEP
ncbi:MAG: hypothetical protein KME13_26795 [Myxacorys californica WJT36-NPBG1]|jgi:hypothetical protein|nr:hypothetical protein [Myxacorys californica WJT36-NPBG1]